ncbi:ATP-binding protein [Mycobacterium sp. ST-F2]|uniref:ATP-binding protein n=1 Tax=Mycobacterium sp. ST-F2 TaxID=1490484 RepID=UPI00114FCE93|nr:ATP-binding protein [Mycobacterium sp. ST-F2]
MSSDGVMVFLDDVLVQHAGWLRANTELSIHTDLRPTYVVGDAKLLNRAVAALIQHARCNAVSAIELVVYRRDAQAVIIVSDDGPHIAVAKGEHQDPAASPSSSERHCGLELAARIIATHGGTLAVGERGACANAVSVRLPSTRQSWRNSTALSGISGGF